MGIRDLETRNQRLLSQTKLRIPTPHSLFPILQKNLLRPQPSRDLLGLFGKSRGHLDGDEKSAAFQALHFAAGGARYFALFRGTEDRAEKGADQRAGGDADDRVVE